MLSYIGTLLLVVLAGCARSEDPVILDLGGQLVRRSDFERHLQGLEARGGATLTPEVRAALLQPYLEERVVVLEARARGLVGAQATAEEERAAAERLLAEATVSGRAVSEEEIAAHFAAHRERYRTSERVSLRQILVGTPQAAEDALRQLAADPSAFELLARRLSMGPEASEGGFMGVFERGQLPTELEEAAFTAPVGAHTGVVKSPLGYHVLRVEARQPAHEPSLDESRERIRALLARDKSDRLVRTYVQTLLSRAKVNHAAAQGPRAHS